MEEYFVMMLYAIHPRPRMRGLTLLRGHVQGTPSPVFMQHPRQNSNKGCFLPSGAELGRLNMAARRAARDPTYAQNTPLPRTPTPLSRSPPPRSGGGGRLPVSCRALCGRVDLSPEFKPIFPLKLRDLQESPKHRACTLPRISRSIAVIPRD